MHRLELKEYEPYVWEGSLDRDQLQALAKAHVDVSPATDQEDAWLLRPSSYVGAVNIGELAVIVRPKIPVDRVMFLMTYALDPKHWRNESIELTPDDDVLEAVALAFARRTQQAVHRGLLRGYRRVEDALNTVRGQIRFTDQVGRRYGLPLPIEVAYDEYTEDIEQNRLLKTATHRLAHTQIRSVAARQEVRRLRPAFDLVQLGSYAPGAVPEIRYTRLDEHYRPAVELARLIIENSSLEPDEDGRIDVEPELSWWPPGSAGTGSLPCFVGDAKYKKLELQGFRHADIYQMLAYCTAAGLPSGLLIYAAGEDEPTTYRINHAGKTIEVASLDLSGTPEAILDSVRQLAGRVHDHVPDSPLQAVA